MEVDDAFDGHPIIEERVRFDQRSHHESLFSAKYG